MVRLTKLQMPQRQQELQWGHVFSDMVRPPGQETEQGRDLLGVLQWGHVFSDMVRERGCGGAARGGALQWGHVFSDMVSIVTVRRRKRSFPLQWGHVFSDMVRAALRSGQYQDVEASMGPRLFRHGKSLLIYENSQKR